MSATTYTPSHLSDLVLHSTPEFLAGHVERHFAHTRALDAAHFAWPMLRQNPAFNSPRTLIRALRRGPGSAEYADLQGGYRLVVTQTIRHSTALGWRRGTPRGATLHLSPTGMLVVVRSGTVASAFFAGMRPADSWTNDSRDCRADRPDADSPVRAYFRAVVRPALTLISTTPEPDAATHLSEYAVLAECPGIACARKFAGWCDACCQVGWNPEGGS